MDIGGAILGKAISIIAAPMGRQVGYLIHHKRNLRHLQFQLDDLNAAREHVMILIQLAERNGEMILPEVLHWLSKVDQIIGEADYILRDEHANMKCLHGFCPNPIIIHKQSRKSMKFLETMTQSVHASGSFYTISCPAPPPELIPVQYFEAVDSMDSHPVAPQELGTPIRDYEAVDSMVSHPVAPQEASSPVSDSEVVDSMFLHPGAPQEEWTDYEAFDSRVSTLKKIMFELRNPNTKRIGVYGLGGVGKTTIVKEVYWQALEEKLFDDVVMILDVNKNPNPERIKKKIAEQLGLDVVEIETGPGRAGQIRDWIKEKKTLLILDDLWKNVDLEAVGITNVGTCKVLWTSRSRKLCSSDEMEKVFQVDVLSEQETWRFFEKIAGDVVNRPAIKTVAMQISKLCGGWPLLTITVASALKDQLLSVWNEALKSLKEIDMDGQFTGTVHSDIIWSYNQLPDEKLKLFFLLCGITAWRNYISTEDLLKYSLGLGWFESFSIEEARSSLLASVEDLKDYCLLLDTNENDLVKIHDLVRNVAIFVALRDHKIFSIAYGEELKEWPNNDVLETCSMISLPYCKIPSLPDVLACPEVKVFHLSSDGSLKFPSSFFEQMRNLQVLGLTDLCIPSLPPSLEFLTNIRTLGLHGCKLEDIALVGQLTNLEILSFARSNVKQLPKEIQHLSRLRLLDLSNCTDLEVIFPDVIASLKRLEDLRMKRSFNQWEAEVVVGERSNARISELKQLTQLTALAIHIPDADNLPGGLFTNKLDRYQILIGQKWKWDGEDKSFDRLLKLKLSTSSQLDRSLEMLLKSSESLHIDASEGFSNIYYQQATNDFQQLKHLHLQNNAEISYITNEKVVLHNLTSLMVYRCHGLKFLLSAIIAKSLVQLKHLEVSECQIMQEIVQTKDYGEEDVDDMFPKLERLVLNDLPNLSGFCSRNYIEFPSLETLHLEKCTKLETFIFNPSSDNFAIYKENFLFDQKVGFPRLDRLIIIELPKLTTIWCSQLALNSFCRLKGVTVRQCNRLKNILPESTIAVVFQHLQKLTVEQCEVTEIVAQEDVQDTLMPDQVVFPDVTCLEFKSLLQLKSFYPRTHAFKWPKLKKLVLSDCPYVGIFASEFLCLQKSQDLHFRNRKSKEMGGQCAPVKQSFVLIEKSSFPILEDLTLGQPALAALHQEAVFVGINSRHIDGTPPQIRVLRLHGMEKLLRLSSSEPAGRVFPELDLLEVKYCGFNNLELSAISFRNLTNLEVTFCSRLQYLTTSSVAQNLVQLKKLKVDECKSLTEILANDGIGEGSSNGEIIFRQLQHLELSDLINLERFCSRNYTVRVPSLHSSTLVVNLCPVKLKISTVGVLEVVSDVDVQSPSGNKEVVDTSESASSLGTNQNQSVSNASEAAQNSAREIHDDGIVSELNHDQQALLDGISEREGVEAVIQGNHVSSQNMKHSKIMDPNQEHIAVTNSPENFQEAANLQMQGTVIQPLNVIVTYQGSLPSVVIDGVDATVKEVVFASESEQGVNSDILRSVRADGPTHGDTDVVLELPVCSGVDASEVDNAIILGTAPSIHVVEASSEQNLPLQVPQEPIKVLSSADKLKRFDTAAALLTCGQSTQSSQETETAKVVISRLFGSSVDLLESIEAENQFKEALEILVTQKVIPPPIQTRTITFLRDIKEAKESGALATEKLASLNQDIKRENLVRSKLGELANEGKQFQLQADSRSQRILKFDMEISSEEEMTKEIEWRDHEQKIADERLATIDSLTLQVANYPDRRAALVDCQSDKDLADGKVVFLYSSMKQLLEKNLNS